jgi:hypothetical protein
VKQALRSARLARPVDPEEAARGRLDVATVSDWGTGAPEELGNLRVTKMRTRFDPAADRPLSVQLAALLEQLEVSMPAGAEARWHGDTASTNQVQAQRLAYQPCPLPPQLAAWQMGPDRAPPCTFLSQAQGALRLADGGRPLPPFKRWSFTAARYLQYLADMAAVHTALEDALAAAAGSPDMMSVPVAAALAQVGPGCGLHRGRQLRSDLAALQRVDSSSTASHSASIGSGKSSSGGAAAAAAATSCSNSRVVALQPGGSAAAYASYMVQLAATAQSAAATPAERDGAALRLLASAYSLLSSFHSLGTRAGAAAAERTGAAAAGALRCYTDYPDLLGAAEEAPAAGGRGKGPDPAAALVAAVDAAGVKLSVAQRQVVFDELPRAFPKAALMVAALAHED